jgi:pyroglutamyl-peptidase
VTRILLTGFEPFGGEMVNSSHEAGLRLAAEGITGAELHYLQLPVVRHAAVGRAVAELLRLRPAAVVMLGQANGRARITPERIAINVDEFRQPDNAGNQPRDEVQIAGAAAAYLCTLPVSAMVDAIKAAGVPAAVSNTAGTFLCNHVTFGLLHAITAQRLAVRAGFIHLPLLPQQAATKPAEVASMGLETLLVGLRAALHVVAEDCRGSTDIGRAAGHALRSISRSACV